MWFNHARFMAIAVTGLWLIAGTTPSAADIINVPDDFPTIQEAIDAAVEGDEVVVGPGAYFEAINFLGKAITVRSSVGAETTIIDAAGAGTVVTCDSGEGVDTVLDGFTITGGDAQDGGGMYNLDSSPTVTNCIFTGNFAFGHGGGMAITGGSPTVVGCTFHDNLAAVNDAGDGGGGMSISGNAVVANCSFTENTGGQPDLPLPLGHDYHTGGGILVRDGSPTILGCTFTRNFVHGFGGGIGTRGGDPTVIDCTFSRNRNFPTFSGSGGGAISNRGDSLSVTNCTFSLNISSSRGGGIYNDDGSLTVTNCTFSGNHGTGGGVYHADGFSPTLVNCVLWGNVSDEKGTEEVGGELTVTYSNVQGGFEGTGNIDADPLFVDAENGDLRLSAGSPAIDAADNEGVPKSVTTDLDGNPRFVDDPKTKDTGNGRPPIVDMGAYEFQVVTCEWDLDGDDSVGTSDLILLLGSWGDPYGTADLIELLGNWGPCP